MEFVEKLETEHVLAALQSLGWMPGKRPPTYVDVRLKCKELFGNGGDGNRLKELRGQAIAMESGVPLAKTDDDPAPHRLPEDLQREMKALARAIDDRLILFDSAAATYLDRHRAAADADASARINVIRREAAERAEAYDEEISAALSAIQDRDATIEKLEAKLSSAQVDTAHAEGRASVLADQVMAQASRLTVLEQECDIMRAEREKLIARIEALEKAELKASKNAKTKVQKSAKPNNKPDSADKDTQTTVLQVVRPTTEGGA
ncbi:hypothetical protein [Oryzomonas rubra]|uniref:Replication region DNA-binding N-term n=1 Tax=Oryzomonas rubra TaxID=2509454 RepID=A0A5A9XQY6_9BACT|nr:hypothetical protein [Oryzomonas rubra]KAA0895466.1 hypothetical protein ET418_02805 [Oryzomonas rubra]